MPADEKDRADSQPARELSAQQPTGPLLEALERIADIERAQDSDPLEWAVWAHELARTTLGYDREPGPSSDDHRSYQDLKAERDRLRDALREAADQLDTAAGQFQDLYDGVLCQFVLEGLIPAVNAVLFAEKAKQARAAAAAPADESAGALTSSSDGDFQRELVDEGRRIVNLVPGIDPGIYRVLNECERRLRNGSDTIGEYQRLTRTDYPGTLKRRIELGQVIINYPPEDGR